MTFDDWKRSVDQALRPSNLTTANIDPIALNSSFNSGQSPILFAKAVQADPMTFLAANMSPPVIRPGLRQVLKYEPMTIEYMLRWAGYILGFCAFLGFVSAFTSHGGSDAAERAADELSRRFGLISGFSCMGASLCFAGFSRVIVLLKSIDAKLTTKP